MKKQISFKSTKEEAELVQKIVERAQSLDKDLDALSLTMDLLATHATDTPLDFTRMLEADNFNFAHDVYGIMRHLNRRTGKLENCFLPRCARRNRT